MRFAPLALVAGSLALGGCASFDGMQEPVVSADTAADLVTKTYGIEPALKQIAGEQDKQAYRNRVMAIWMMAIDARYDAFRRDLSRGKKGASVGLDVLTLGLTATASVWESAADELAAVATGVGGASASLDRELYFEKTLPVLISYMDSERLGIRAQMLQGMRRPITEYPLEQGFADLWHYQSAGSLDRAIDGAARGAADRADEAEAAYADAVEFCVPDAEVRDRRGALQDRMVAGFDGSAEQKQAALARFNRGAALAGKASVGDDATDAEKERQGLDALAHLRGLCKPAQLDEFERVVFEGEE